MALSARSWPIRPAMGCSSSVVLKPNVVGLTTRRNCPGSSGCGRAATVVTSPLVAAGTLLYCARLKNMRLTRPPAVAGRDHRRQRGSRKGHAGGGLAKLIGATPALTNITDNTGVYR